LPGTRKRHNTTAGTARIRKYVKTLGKLTALTAAGAGATVFMGRTRALEVGERQWGGSGRHDHELGTPLPKELSGLHLLDWHIPRCDRIGKRQHWMPSLAPFMEEIVDRLRHGPADARDRDEVVGARAGNGLGRTEMLQ